MADAALRVRSSLLSAIDIRFEGKVIKRRYEDGGEIGITEGGKKEEKEEEEEEKDEEDEEEEKEEMSRKWRKRKTNYNRMHAMYRICFIILTSSRLFARVWDGSASE